MRAISYQPAVLTLARRQNSIVVSIIVLVGALLRYSHLLIESVWFDEFLTVQTIGRDWRTVLTGSYPSELHPPLYFAALKLWIVFLGSGELNMRLFSLSAALLSIVLMYVIGSVLGGWRVGGTAAALLAFHPGHIYYSVEIRMYSLLVCLSLVSIVAFLFYQMGTIDRRISLIILLVSTVMVMYTHYFGILLPVGAIVFSLYRRIFQRDLLQNRAIVVLSIALLLFIPAVLYIFLPQARFYDATYGGAPYQRLTPMAILSVLAGSVSIKVFDITLANLLTLVCVLAGALLLFFSPRRAFAVFFLTFIVGSTIGAILASYWGVNVTGRYLLHISLCSLLLAACALMPAYHRYAVVANVFGVALLIALAVSGSNYVLSSTLSGPDWRSVARAVRDVREAPEPVVIMGWDALPVGYYLGDSVPVLTSMQLDQQIQESTAAASYVVVDSESSAKRDYLKAAEVLYQVPVWHIRILRYRSGL